ncbi:MAG: hypothetical protein OXI67_01075 [Candidatus Poribacteria bacterium]|nr:hypothetical protein [Candidatus Poribacteria bacterium]
MQSRNTLSKITIFFLMVSILILIDISHAIIVFRDSHTGQSEIYIMDDNGKNVRQLTHTPLSEYMPRFSPDGRHIVFGRNLGPVAEPRQLQQLDIFIINADGSNEKRLTFHPKIDFAPTWSPDGQHIAFVSTRIGHGEIHILELASGNIKQLTKNEDGDAYSSAPSWSPDGQHIVHEQVIAGGGRHIYITDIDGKDTRPFLKGDQPHLVGDMVISKYAPSWSPDGKHVLYYESHKRYENARVVRLANHLIVVNKIGGNPKKLRIPKSWWLHSASWAWGGTHILFAGEKDGFQNEGKRNYEIYRYRLSNGKITQITDTPHKEYDPHWVPGTLSVSPEGKLGVQWGKIKEEK